MLRPRHKEKLMINVTIGDRDGTLWLSMEGHAGMAPKGEDIVCAAATMLMYTAAQAAMDMGSRGELQRPPAVKLDDGNAGVAFRPKAEAVEKGRLVLDVIRRGLEVLGKRYPENVAIYVIGNGESRGYTEESRAEPADMEPRA